MPCVIGIDPGSKCTGVAVVEDDTLIEVAALRLDSKHTSETIRQLAAPLELLFERLNPDLVVVEGQHYHAGGRSPAKDILKLANVAGAIAGIAATASTAKIAIPPAAEWKGQTPKPMNQARSFAHFGIAYTRGPSFCWPKGCSKVAQVVGYGSLKKVDWKEVADALGLARFGVDLLRS